MISTEAMAIKEQIRGLNWWNHPLEEIRSRMQQMGSGVPIPDGVDWTPVHGVGMKGDWLVPDNARTGKAILYLHGGGYCLGITGINRAFVAQLAKDTGVRTLMADYRLAPEHPFPAAIEDALGSYRWLQEKGHAPADIILMGDSSGCGLGLVMMDILQKEGTPLPGCAAFICPTVDLSHSGESRTTLAETDPYQCRPEYFMDRHYVKGVDPKDPRLSPLFGTLMGLPPMLIHAAGDDIFLSDGIELAGKVERNGGTAELKVWQGLWHVFHMCGAALPEARDAVAELAEFIGRQSDWSV